VLSSLVGHSNIRYQGIKIVPMIEALFDAQAAEEETFCAEKSATSSPFDEIPVLSLGSDTRT